MRIRVRLFAIIKDRAGSGELSLDLPEGSTVAAASLALREKLPPIAGFLDRAAFAVNREYAGAETVLRAGDELAVIPPVSGGAGEWNDPFIRISETPIDAAALLEHVADPGAGGIDVFLGTTRAERNDDGRELVALDYEAYREMAEEQLRQLAAEARRRWPIVRLAIVHRIGRVELAKPSVVIAVASPHRAEAFDACRWIIDTLKKDVAIWKKAVWSDGSGTWVHPE